MSYNIDDECVQLSDEDNPDGAWLDVQDIGRSLHIDATGPVYMDADNYPKSAFFNVRLNLDDVIVLREFLTDAIERMKHSVE